MESLTSVGGPADAASTSAWGPADDASSRPYLGFVDWFSPPHLLQLPLPSTHRCGPCPHRLPSRSPSLLPIMATTPRPVRATPSSYVVSYSHEVAGGRRPCGVGFNLVPGFPGGWVLYIYFMLLPSFVPMSRLQYFQTFESHLLRVTSCSSQV